MIFRLSEIARDIVLKGVRESRGFSVPKQRRQNETEKAPAAAAWPSGFSRGHEACGRCVAGRHGGGPSAHALGRPGTGPH